MRETKSLPEEVRDRLAALETIVAAVDARLTLALRVGGAAAGALLLFIVSASLLLVSQAVGGPGPEALPSTAVAIAHAIDQAVRS